MRSLLHGLSGWARFQHADTRAIQDIDAAITVVATVLIVLAWIIVRP